MKADVPMRRRTNRPNMDAEGSVQGQVNGDIDPMVREGTAHLDIDEATRARYRYHNGHWWYQTENGQWLFDNNGSWESFDPMTYRNPRQQMAPPQTFQNDSDGNAQVDVDSGAYYYDNSSDNGYYYDNGSYYSGNYGSPYYNNRGRRFYNGRGYYNGGYYGDGYYGRGYNNRGWNQGWNNGRHGTGYRGWSDRRRGAAIGAEIGGSLGGRTGAAIGAGIGAEVAD